MSTPEAVQAGPCTPWVSAEDVAAACDALEASDVALYEEFAQQAYDYLFEASGRIFRGECGPITVRPCKPNCVCWPDPCGCCYLSTITLSGDPIREITEVKIDGVVIEPTEYRLDKRRELVRLADVDGNRQRWPACQRLDLDDTEEGTFSVSYTYGQDVPLLGQQAAVELACQLASGSPQGGGECDIPESTVEVIRQGMRFEVNHTDALSSLSSVSRFLAAYNPHGLRRRSAVWSPDLPKYPQQVG